MNIKDFSRKIGLMGITNILVALSSIILLPILTKNLSINDYGLWVQINITLSLIPNIVTLGLPYTMVRFFAAVKNKQVIAEGFYTISISLFLLSFLTSLVFIIFSKQISELLFSNEILIVVIVAIILFFACMNFLFFNYFRTFSQMKRYSIFTLLQTFLNITLVSYFVFLDTGIIGAALGLLTTQIVIFILLILIIYFDIGFIIPKFNKLKEYLTFGLPTLPGSLSFWVVDSSDRYLINILMGTDFVGYYSPGYTLGNIISMFIAPFSLILPSISSYYYDNQKLSEVKQILDNSLKYFLIFSIPAVFGLSLLSKEILLILTTPDIALNGYLVTPFVAISAVIMGVYVIYSQYLVLKKKTKLIGYIWIIAGLSNFILNLVFIPLIGIIGAAAMTLVSYFVAMIISVFYSGNYITLNYKIVIKILLSSLIMSLFIYTINPEGILKITIVIIFSSILYLSVMYFLKGIEKKDIKFFFSLLTKDQ